MRKRPNPTVPRTCKACGISFLAHAWFVRDGQAQYCSRKCTYEGKRWTPEEFWGFIEKTDTCWIWNGKRDKDGYGEISFLGRAQKAHRIAWKLSIGPIPPKIMVCHHCDNPPCCNPAHLFLGTAKDNTQDMISKNRNAHGKVHPNAVLTEEKVKQARIWYESGEKNMRQIAAELNVSYAAIVPAIHRKWWKHVP